MQQHWTVLFSIIGVTNAHKCVSNSASVINKQCANDCIDKCDQSTYGSVTMPRNKTKGVWCPCY